MSHGDTVTHTHQLLADLWELIEYKSASMRAVRVFNCVAAVNSGREKKVAAVVVVMAAVPVIAIVNRVRRPVSFELWTLRQSKADK